MQGSFAGVHCSFGFGPFGLSSSGLHSCASNLASTSRSAPSGCCADDMKGAEHASQTQNNGFPGFKTRSLRVSIRLDFLCFNLADATVGELLDCPNHVTANIW